MTTSPAKRILGVVMVLVAAASLVATVFGAIQIWAIRQPLTDGLVTGIGVMSGTLDTTGEALVVVMNSLETVDKTVSAVGGTTLATAKAISDTRIILDSVAKVTGEDLPTSVQAARKTLKSAQTSAAMVDNVLTALSQVPLLNIRYEPDVPLSKALGGIDQSLDRLPASLDTLTSGLSGGSENLGRVSEEMASLAVTTQGVQSDVVEARGVVERYQAEVSRLQGLMKPLSASIGYAVTLGVVGLTFILFWLGVLQAMVLLKGLEWVRAPRVSATDAIEGLP